MENREHLQFPASWSAQLPQEENGEDGAENFSVDELLNFSDLDDFAELPVDDNTRHESKAVKDQYSSSTVTPAAFCNNYLSNTRYSDQLTCPSRLSSGFPGDLSEPEHDLPEQDCMSYLRVEPYYSYEDLQKQQLFSGITATTSSQPTHQVDYPFYASFVDVEMLPFTPQATVPHKVFISHKRERDTACTGSSHLDDPTTERSSLVHSDFYASVVDGEMLPFTPQATVPDKVFISHKRDRDTACTGSSHLDDPTTERSSLVHSDFYASVVDGEMLSFTPQATVPDKVFINHKRDRDTACTGSSHLDDPTTERSSLVHSDFYASVADVEMLPFTPQATVPDKVFISHKRDRDTACTGSSHLDDPTTERSSLVHSGIINPNPNKPQAKRKKEETSPDGVARRCRHCATEKTPQWRAGPAGPKSLCNACGVRFKSGRLVPEYRPASSPTFTVSENSNSHRKVVEIRRRKGIPTDPPVNEGAVMAREGAFAASRHNFLFYQHPYFPDFLPNF